jgi:hypothetical protein
MPQTHRFDAGETRLHAPKFHHVSGFRKPFRSDSVASQSRRGSENRHDLDVASVDGGRRRSFSRLM